MLSCAQRPSWGPLSQLPYLQTWNLHEDRAFGMPQPSIRLNPLDLSRDFSKTFSQSAIALIGWYEAVAWRFRQLQYKTVC